MENGGQGVRPGRGVPGVPAAGTGVLGGILMWGGAKRNSCRGSRRGPGGITEFHMKRQSIGKALGRRARDPNSQSVLIKRAQC